MTAPTTTATPVLRMRGISKAFLGVRVLSDIDLDVAPGEVHAIVGENGAGKSTLMKILAGVYRPDAGRLELGGVDAAFEHPLEAQQAGVSTVFQEFNLLPERTVGANDLVRMMVGRPIHQFLPGQNRRHVGPRRPIARCRRRQRATRRHRPGGTRR